MKARHHWPSLSAATTFNNQARQDTPRLENVTGDILGLSDGDRFAVPIVLPYPCYPTRSVP